MKNFLKIGDTVYVTSVLGKKRQGKIISEVYRKTGVEFLVEFPDKSTIMFSETELNKD